MTPRLSHCCTHWGGIGQDWGLGIGFRSYRTLIDTGSSHSWVKPHIGDSLQRHSLEGYVVDRGDGAEENASVFHRGSHRSARKMRMGCVTLTGRMAAFIRSS